MTSMISTKCDRSFPLVHPELIEATVRSVGDSEQPSECLAELRELSPSSAKLLVTGPPALPCRCRLRLVSSKLMRTLDLAAEIGWAKPNPAGDWLVECEFEQRINESIFKEVLDSGLLERRSAVRFQTRIQVGVRWTADEVPQPAMVRDISEGGLCLMTSLPPRPQREVFVLADTPAGPITIHLKVRWTLGVGPNHLIGCQFIHGRDFHALRNLQASVPTFSEHSRAARPR